MLWWALFSFSNCVYLSLLFHFSLLFFLFPFPIASTTVTKTETRWDDLMIFVSFLNSLKTPPLSWVCLNWCSSNWCIRIKDVVHNEKFEMLVNPHLFCQWSLNRKFKNSVFFSAEKRERSFIFKILSTIRADERKENVNWKTDQSCVSHRSFNFKYERHVSWFEAPHGVESLFKQFFIIF